MRLLLGIILFYGRVGLSFTAIGFLVRRLLWRNDSDRLDGKRVLVTGASGGIGAATVAGCHAAGGDVIAVARSADKLEALRRDVSSDVVTEVVDLAETREIGKGSFFLVAGVETVALQQADQIATARSIVVDTGPVGSQRVERAGAVTRFEGTHEAVLEKPERA